MDEKPTGDAGAHGRGVLRTTAVLFVAAACGWMVMQLEILGGRAIHPINVTIGGFYRAPRKQRLQALLPQPAPRFVRPAL